MNLDESYIIRGKCIITMSIAFIIVSIGLFLGRNNSINNTTYEFRLEQVNIKNMSTVAAAIKKGDNSKTINLSGTYLPTSKEPSWRLPTDYGYITQYPSYNHNSLDITSTRGTYESIYPVADGIIAKIYYDNAGALTVMVNHNINGQQYLSQYVHLSSFAPGIYEGMPVTTNDRLGQMGATGIATGVHLHLAVMPCNFGSGSITGEKNC